jgi:hypothetical protein
MGKELAIWSPQNMTEAMVVAERIANTAFVPKELRGKPNECLMAMMHGNEIGLSPVVALQSIAVINGKPSIWGDAALALVKAHPDFADIKETFNDDKHEAVCVITRKGQTPVERTFSWNDAERAGLAGKNTYKQYPKRMLQMRARSFAMRDSFPDALKGIGIREEAQDYPAEPRDVTEPANPVEAKLAELKGVLEQAVADGLCDVPFMDAAMKDASQYTDPTIIDAIIEKAREQIQPQDTHIHDEITTLGGGRSRVFREVDDPEEATPIEPASEYDPAEDAALDLF